MQGQQTCPDGLLHTERQFLKPFFFRVAGNSVVRERASNFPRFTLIASPHAIAADTKTVLL